MTKLEELMRMADECIAAAAREGFMPGGFSKAHAALESALKQVCEDARRYRWLRDDSACEFGEPWAITRYEMGDLRNSDAGTCPLCGDALDTAIDAAMAKDQPSADGKPRE